MKPFAGLLVIFVVLLALLIGSLALYLRSSIRNNAELRPPKPPRRPRSRPRPHWTWFVVLLGPSSLITLAAIVWWPRG